MEECNDVITKKSKKRKRRLESENDPNVSSLSEQQSAEKLKKKTKKKRKSRVPKMTQPHNVAIEFYLRRERVERSYAHLLAFLHSDLDLRFAKRYLSQLKGNPKIHIDEEKGVISYLVIIT